MKKINKICVLVIAVLLGLNLFAILPVSAKSQDDLLFFSDYSNGTITRINLATGETQVIASGLSSPEDGACNAQGQIFFAETKLGKITRFEQDGSNKLVIFDSSFSAPPKLQPEGLSFDINGNLYFNTGGRPPKPEPHQGVYQIPGGLPTTSPIQVVPQIAGNAHGEGTAFLRTGEILVTDANNNNITISSPPYFGPGNVFASGMEFPVGIAVRSDGDVFVSEGSGLNPGILHYDSSGALIETFVTINGATLRHMEFDSSDNLYVAAHTDLYKIAPDKQITSFATSRTIVGVAIYKPFHIDFDIKPGSDPNSINIKSKGKWISATIELGKGYNACTDIDISTILLDGSISPIVNSKYGWAKSEDSYCSDNDGDGFPELLVKFDRAEITKHYGPGVHNVTITGQLLDGREFVAFETIRLIDPGK